MIEIDKNNAILIASGLYSNTYLFLYSLRSCWGFLFIPVPVEGNSMENVLKQGDMVVMEKFSEIRRFDIVVFQLADGTIYIKRVIGLPGENVSYQNDQLKINGKVVKEPYLTKT